MWVKQCHQPTMTEHGKHTTYKDGDLGDGYGIVLPTLFGILDNIRNIGLVRYWKDIGKLLLIISRGLISTCFDDVSTHPQETSWDHQQTVYGCKILQIGGLSMLMVSHYKASVSTILLTAQNCSTIHSSSP